MTTVLTSADKSSRPLLRHGYWHLVPGMARQELQTRYAQSSFRLAWLVVQPLVLVGIYAVFFNGVLDISGDQIPYLTFIMCGFVPWRFFAGAMSASGSITDMLGVITKVYFPREIIPIVRAVTCLPDLAIGLVLTLAIAWAQGYPPQPGLLLLPLPLFVVLAFSAAMGIIVTVVAVFVRDLNHGTPLLLQGLFFATPIMYPVSKLPSWLSWLATVNPLAVAIDGVRDLVTAGHLTQVPLLLLHAVGSALLLVVALAYTRSVEHRMVDIA